MAKTIEDYMDGRNNNYNLLRFLAAFSVVWSHAAIVVGGNDAVEPLSVELGYTLGSLAVNVFFVISGFLMAQSYLRSNDIWKYAAARVLRLIPGLFVAALLSAFLFGPLFTQLEFAEYFSTLQTWLYVPITSSLIDDYQNLPGVFEILPAAGEINTPLWTLRWEAAAYVGVGLLGIFGILANKKKFGAVLCIFVVLYFVISLATDLRTSLAPVDHMLRFGLCYLVGAAGFLYRESLPLNLPVFALLCLITFFVSTTEVYQFTLILTLGYGTIWAAYVPSRGNRAFNNWGDFSYGIYIYGFTVKQMVFSTLPEIETYTLFLIAAPITILLAAASYYIVEKPALSWRFKFATGLKEFSKSRYRSDL
ncbi:acyltransferase family protein [Maritalea porphyrae]|uniref:acyltransferase family protein n=1 Tax=Maritalea porphyrae TaxID=880732 RepID=UPI0022B053C3|nr:acyltransferase [Maritalea porphyrae]MCZ4273354.1 acyltransferase [Maritalea porphyrae]